MKLDTNLACLINGHKPKDLLRIFKGDKRSYLRCIRCIKPIYFDINDKKWKAIF